MQLIDWEKIVRQHGADVWRTAYRLLGNEADACDCFQESFVYAVEAAKKRRIRHFSALLRRIATSKAIDQLRRRYGSLEAKRVAFNVDAIDSQVSDQFGPEEIFAGEELAQQLRGALLQLTEEESHVFCLRFLNEMSYREIGREMGIKTKTVGAMLHRARVKMKICLDSVSKEKNQMGVTL